MATTSSLSFDKYGHLIPYDVIEIDFSTLEKTFVHNFPNSSTRKILFNNYERFIYRFQDEVFPFFEQWINGSFVTMKENPKDIDIVTFLDYQVYEKRGEATLDKFWTFSLEDDGIDSYIVKEYPENHQKYLDFLELKNQWLNTYNHSNPKKGKEILPKGFLKIKFEK